MLDIFTFSGQQPTTGGGIRFSSRRSGKWLLFCYSYYSVCCSLEARLLFRLSQRTFPMRMLLGNLGKLPLVLHIYAYMTLVALHMMMMMITAAAQPKAKHVRMFRVSSASSRAKVWLDEIIFTRPSPLLIFTHRNHHDTPLHPWFLPRPRPCFVWFVSVDHRPLGIGNVRIFMEFFQGYFSLRLQNSNE